MEDDESYEYEGFDDIDDSMSTLKIPTDSYIIKEFSEIPLIKQELINDIVALMGLTVEEAEIMLQKYNWNKEKLMDAFFNNVNVKKESGLGHYSPTLLNELKNLESNDSMELFFCQICRNEACSITEKFHLGCEHIYCRECYGGYIRYKVLKLSCTSIKCPEPTCMLVVPPSFIKHFLHSEEEQSEYEKSSIANFLNIYKNVRQCQCTRIAIGESGINSTVTCLCGLVYCFKCGEEPHFPATCLQVATWKTIRIDDLDSVNYLYTNTVNCPKCQVCKIEKVSYFSNRFVFFIKIE
jgi:ariadne-1